MHAAAIKLIPFWYRCDCILGCNPGHHHAGTRNGHPERSRGSLLIDGLRSAWGGHPWRTAVQRFVVSRRRSSCSRFQARGGHSDFIPAATIRWSRHRNDATWRAGLAHTIAATNTLSVDKVPLTCPL